MYSLIAVAIALVVLGEGSRAQQISFGGCEDVAVKENLDVQKYAGEWYEIEKNPVPFEAGLKCIKANYGLEDDYLTVENKGVSERTGKESSTLGKATIPDKSVSAKLKVKFNGMPFSGDYWILDTDYDQYSVVYSCFSVFRIINADYLWILSRTPTLDENVKQNIYKFLDENMIDRSRLQPTTQDC